MREKMPLEERAKIFLPFSALKGYEEALRRKEREAEAAEKPQERNHAEKMLENVHPGDRIAVLFSVPEGYMEATGEVLGIDTTARVLALKNREIAFSSILQLERRG